MFSQVSRSPAADFMVISQYCLSGGATDRASHSAFVNESCPASAPPRASVEVRVFAFYEE